MKQIFKTTGLLLVLSVLLVTCGKSYNEKQINKETPTRGNIQIGVDEAYKLIVDSEIVVFESIYKYAHIKSINASEDSILKLFLADSVRLMITSRKLTANEEAFLKDKLTIVRTTPIAWDAIAFVVNKSNPDRKIRYDALKDIFSGNVTKWKQINPNSSRGDIQVVFDNQGSSNIRSIMNKLNITSLPEYCYTADSNPGVIDYVENNPNALGIISVNWISDPDDSITHAFLDRVNVVALTPDTYSESNDFYTPHPAYIADKSYPFIREVYAISRETFSGLGSGFINFVAHDQGQRIVLKMGMLPATMPIRLIQVRKE
jgi:phosphate transport system substrate-binding protein